MQSDRGHWGSNVGFILAATGSAIGLGNLWRFPYITWDNNGGAFVLVYLVCILLVGMPIMMAELLIGRRTQKSTVGALRECAGKWWGVFGVWGVFCAFLLLSYYTVIAGWSLYYFARTAAWSAGGYPAGLATGDLFATQVGNAGLQLVLSLGFSLATIAVVWFGVRNGIERLARVSLPILFGILLLLLVSALGMRPACPSPASSPSCATPSRRGPAIPQRSRSTIAPPSAISTRGAGYRRERSGRRSVPPA